jgi:hypothetical protein
MNETELRMALREYAASFEPSGRGLDRRAPRRRLARSTVAAAALLAAAAVTAILFFGPGHPRSPATDTATGSRSAPSVSGDAVRIDLVGYAAPVNGEMPKGLQDHLSCMRAHGYDLPNPEWKGSGWMLTVQDARGLGVGTSRWKRTVFITCALTRPGGHDMPGLRQALLHPRERSRHGGAQ